MKIGRSLIVFILQVFTDDGILMLLDAQVEVTARVTYIIRITRIELLTIATKDQLFQFNGDLYKQIDGVAMGSPLGPLMANTFMCSIEEKLVH